MNTLRIPVILVIWLSPVGCNLFDRKARQEFEYVPLNEYKYDKVSIQPGTEFEIIAFSGGNRSDKDNIYYYQFITTEIPTGDTFRILTPLIAFESVGEVSLTHTTPLQFDPAKGVTRAYYTIQDSSQNLALQVHQLVNEESVDTTADILALMKSIKANQLVVLNKSIPIFENPDYKTAVGILNFKSMPW